MNQFIYRLNYFDAPLVTDRNDDTLILESIRNRVWNPVFTAGVIAFVLSMTLRGFFNQRFAVVPLGLSTLVLFAGVWKLSSVAMIIFDKKESKLYLVYKHLGYLQKVYTHGLTSLDGIEVKNINRSKFRLQLQKDNASQIRIADSSDKVLLLNAGREISSFLQIPFLE